MNSDEEFMREAIREAECAAAAGEVPVGAVAVYDGRIAGRARNRIEELQDASAHAEVLLIREIAAARRDWRLDGFTFYVTKEPCAMCAGAMVNAHLKKVVFGLRDPRSGACGSALNITGFPGMLWQVEVVGGVLESECLRQFREFFRSVRSGGRAKPPVSC